MKIIRKDKEILEKLGTTIKLTDEHIENFQFGQALHAIYDFIWRDFADQYIEYSKLMMPKKQSKLWLMFFPISSNCFILLCLS